MLKRQKFSDAIPAGLPPGTPVAHKTGTITQIHHDAAIVYGPRPYVLVVLVRGIQDQKVSARADGVDLARGVERIVSKPRMTRIPAMNRAPLRSVRWESRRSPHSCPRHERRRPPQRHGFARPRRRRRCDDQAEAPGAGRHGRARQPGQRDVQQRRSPDCQGIARGARLQGARGRAHDGAARQPGRRRQGARGRHQQGVRRQVGCRRPRDPRRLGQRAAAALPRLRHDPPQPEGPDRLQRHHRAATVDPREDRADHVPRPDRTRPLGRLVARLLQARAVQRRGGHLFQQAGHLRRTQQPDAGRVPHADDHARQGARAAARRQSHACSRPSSARPTCRTGTMRSCSARTSARISIASIG